jgi:hypothetical protein
MVFRMLLVACRLVGPHLLTPGRSPLLRWRIETYGATAPDGRLLHADELTAADILRFARRNRRQLLRFLRWAASL